ncbi:FKBP-type peptidyl-prolyl cis-trans isomerase [Phenylobacterium sp.]|jgi:peptidylprolyl isomerase/FKBP-type peptidyl-prolyl cis-trans isomerase FklB|uniref:FKBP-type peptidyl-prolyl cis-trans isomerase n=1 Tax=Phenylobacterium sp. TaxID=1871053 RepID=UPI002F94098E
MMFRTLLIAAAALSLAACQGQKPLPDQSQASRAFIEKTAKEPGVQRLPSGVLYKVVRQGPANGTRPQLSDEVKVHYEGKLIDGKVFDSSYERGQPAAMPLRGLIPAWQEALQLMRPGDEWILYVPPEQGYGPEGAGGEIPPNAALIFRVELIAVLEGPGHRALG